MTTPFWCVLILLLIPYILASLGGAFRVRQLGTLDNKHPRQQAAELEGMGARAYAAQQNAWEALPGFGLAVVIAHIAGADPAASATTAVVFV
ncbi:MAG: MAPEG family protein, partial [Deltaproteobacteria bacterium]|nr:MAPEG family protein [Deltaproteobacteria bacterium]